eukprot:Sdes_comp17523_c0_seq1m6759
MANSSTLIPNLLESSSEKNPHQKRETNQDFQRSSTLEYLNVEGYRNFSSDSTFENRRSFDACLVQKDKANTEFVSKLLSKGLPRFPLFRFNFHLFVAHLFCCSSFFVFRHDGKKKPLRQKSPPRPLRAACSRKILHVQQAESIFVLDGLHL